MEMSDKAIEKTREKKPAPKQRRPDTPEPKGSKSRNRLVRYFQDTGEELRKVTWPTREETLRLTLIVLGSTAAAALVLGLLDLLFQEIMALLV